MCASCSPHRITIPRAFIVRPPKIEVIDLTGDSPPPPYREEPEEEGAEGEVRICEECLGATPRVVGSGSRPVEVPRRAESRRRRLSVRFPAPFPHGGMTRGGLTDSCRPRAAALFRRPPRTITSTVNPRS